MLRGVLLDSGGTVIAPKSGRWNPRFDFEEVTLRHWPSAPVGLFAEAFAGGQMFLTEVGGTPPRRAYHEVVLRLMGLDNPGEELLRDLDAPLRVDDVVFVFSDAVPMLEAVRRGGVGVVIVSDNWATLPSTYEKLGLTRYVDAFVISEMLGCCKPDPRMYRAGSDALGLAPNECLFIDDDPTLVDAAVRLGYAGVVIDRDGSHADCAVPTVARLTDVVDLLAT